jgi:long-chain acyl-CoA synthetase
VEWVVGNSESRIVFVGNNPSDNDDVEKMPNHRLLNVIDKLNQVDVVVMMDGIDTLDSEKAITWEEFIAKGETTNDSEVLERVDAIKPEDTSCLIYTSGTTGNPKGVELTHKNWNCELDSVESTFQFEQGERYVSWLPLAHVFGQLVDNHYWTRHAMHLHVVNSPLFVVDYAKELKPHL